MLENLAPEITKPKIVFYKSNFGMGISMNVPLIYNGEKIGLMEYDLVNEEKSSSSLPTITTLSSTTS